MTPLPVELESARARFWSKVDQSAGPAECWEWAEGRHDQGYGRFWTGERTWYSHRVAYALAYGVIPDGLVVRHACDNPPCCNPAHLEIGTQADNMRDRDTRGRQRSTPMMGEANGQAVLTFDEVGTARQRVAAGESIAAVARDMGRHRRTVWGAVRGHRWPDHPVPPVPSTRKGSKTHA